MDLKQLDTFVRVAELGSFTRAAAVLRVAQPALSRQVRALEVELHQPLFDRNGRGVTLTPAGARLLAHGRGILQQVERARQDLEEQRGAASGLVSIGLPPSISRTLTAPLVETFRERFPRATLSIVEGLSTYTLEWLVQGRVDCAVVYNAVPAAVLELQPVLQERLHLVSVCDTPRLAARGHLQRLVGRPASLAEVAACNLVIPSRPHAIRMQLESAMAEAGLKPRVALEVDSVPAMLDLVQRHALHAVLSLNAVQGSSSEAALQARPLRRADGQPLRTTLYIATSAQRPRGALLDQTTTLLAEQLEQRLAPPDRARASTPRATTRSPAPQRR